ncbi:DUF418 domain-containing protein [Altererythrobacter xixiisoli]|uniref:DUF418 domain-containing protein n=1 Tax=Croceibacterium xixiisoli TaxID=1476466 RepID=A0A6I4TXJ3_9SPHN|nr:DUF418 domain-containing protein [Croceibacterium xixiisoli]
MPRILSLDIIRGIAVMGIFFANVIGMAMIDAAYFHPPTYGFFSALDHIAWAVNYVLVDARFRALFSILFGASLLLITDRAEARDQPAWRAHFPRMAVLLLFGLVHYYWLWWGDILANYALIGMAAFFLRRLPVPAMLMGAVLALLVQHGPLMAGHAQQLPRYEAMRAPDATPADRATYDAMIARASESAASIAADKAAHENPLTHAREMTLPENRWQPFKSVTDYGFETLGLMLLGMAAFRSGLLTGSWPRHHYAVLGLVVTLPSLAIFAFGTFTIHASGYDRMAFYWWDYVWLPMLQPICAMGYIGLILWLFHGHEASATGLRIAAVGRMAFTNYLGATLIGTLLFSGFAGGLYGQLSRGQTWLIAFPVCALMLAWSQPWLARFRYGPLEWVWRSLAQGRWEANRRPPAPSAKPG